MHEASVSAARVASAALWIMLIGISSSASAATIEEVIVTARATEEAIRDIPVAITAVSEERMNTFGIESLMDLEAMTPQLDIGRATSGSGTSIGIRGIFSPSTSIGIEQSVAVIIDGVYISAGPQHQRRSVRHANGDGAEGAAGTVLRQERDRGCHLDRHQGSGR